MYVISLSIDAERKRTKIDKNYIRIYRMVAGLCETAIQERKNIFYIFIILVKQGRELSDARYVHPWAEEIELFS